MEMERENTVFSRMKKIKLKSTPQAERIATSPG